MTCLWHVERARGSGRWFVGLQPSRINVLAPPGVRLHRAERCESGSGVAGWRHAVWLPHLHQHHPMIDRDQPDLLRPISTRTALRLLPEGLWEIVWQLLFAQLLSARAFGEADDGRLASEELARAGAVTALWIEGELRAAFPDRSQQLDRALLTSEPPLEIPDTVEQLLSASCALRSHRRDERAPTRTAQRLSIHVGDQQSACRNIGRFDTLLNREQMSEEPFEDEDALERVGESIRLI